MDNLEDIKDMTMKAITEISSMDKNTVVINNTISCNKDDWRFRDQDRYLPKILMKSSYTRYSEQWDHDHCEFCFATFSEYEGDLHEGYCTIDERHWICADCFEDFKDMFQWEVINEDEA